VPRSLALALATPALLVAVSAGGCGADKEKSPGAQGTAGNTRSASTPAKPTTNASGLPPGPRTCLRVPKPKPKGPQHVPKPGPSQKLKPGATAIVETSCGNFAISLDVKRAPKTAASFAYLSKRGFYDSLTFHRIVPGFVIQGGDPLGTGQGGPGYSVVEAPPGSLHYTRGVVAMAKTEIEDPGTSGSQFFIVTGPDAQLPPDYALVGQVSAGMNVVDRIATQPTNQTSPDPTQREQPVRPIVIRRIEIRGG
jgi:peptidyl-prolyl cis-trans isomerase B (cyclophilin B)